MKQRFLIRLSAVWLIALFFVGTPAVASAATSGSTSKSSTNSSSSSSKTDSGKSTPSTTNNTTTVQGYAADKTLSIGTIVQLAGGGAKVTAATLDKLNQMYGVVVDPHSLSITIYDASIPNESFVATTGTYMTLVSNQGGAIQPGDYITVSSVDGVGMLASPDQKIVLGRATAAFDGKSNVVGSTSLKDSSGKSVPVALGEIPVAIAIAHNPNDKSTKAEVPNWLQRVGEAIAEKPVGAVRIYLSIFITGVSIVAAIVMLSTGVKNSLISIGRNPLSKKSIFRGLLEIVLTSIIVLIIGLFAVYLLLKL